VSCIGEDLVAILVFEAKVKAAGKQDLALPFTLCLQLNHATDIILPLCA